MTPVVMMGWRRSSDITLKDELCDLNRRAVPAWCSEVSV